MSAPIKFATVPSKTLATSINASAYTLQVSDIEGWDSVNLAAADFGTVMFIVLRDSTNTFMEIIQIDPATIASSAITILKRGLDFYGGSTEISANKLTWIKNDTIVELGTNPPQMYKAITDYIDSIAIAGAPNASTVLQGLVQLATSAQITAGTATGSTGAALGVTPDQLAASKYGTQLAPVNGITFLNAVTGMIFPYAGTGAPTGFLLTDGASFDMDTYPTLAGVLLGRYGYGTGQTFTANASTDIITATTHGLSNGNILVLTSTSALPGGLSANTVYYVISVTTNTFQLSATSGGSAINITDTGTGTHTFYNNMLVPDYRGRTLVGSGAGTKIATFVSRASNVITVSGLTNTTNNEFQTGQAILYTAAGGAMTGLVTLTTYYLIRISSSTFSLATTLANAQNGTAIALSSDGTGVQTFTLTFTARSAGDTGGEESHAMSSTEILSHFHSTNTFGSPNLGLTGVAISGNSGGQSSGTVGGNAAMNSMQPFGVANFIIKT